jgi:general secretion pathway protein K
MRFPFSDHLEWRFASAHPTRNTQHATRFNVSARSPSFNPVNHSERAIALVIVMICVFVLTMLAGGFAISMKTETRLARNSNNETELEWMGRSALEYACWVRACSPMNPQQTWDSTDQPWATGSGLLGPTNNPINEVVNPLPFQHGTVSWKLTDLESRVNINNADYDRLEHACLAFTNGTGIGPAQMATICNSIIDWRDPGNHQSPQGANSEYYQSLDPPYVAKNGPIDDISELLLIKGIRDQPELFLAFENTFTALSRGTINWHTAPDSVRQALGMDPNVSANFEQYTHPNYDDNGMPIPMDLNSALLNAGVPQPMVPVMAARFGNTQFSYTFQANIDAEINGYHRYFIAVIGQPARNKDVQILSFYWTDTKPPERPAGATAPVLPP